MIKSFALIVNKAIHIQLFYFKTGLFVIAEKSKYLKLTFGFEEQSVKDAFTFQQVGISEILPVK